MNPFITFREQDDNGRLGYYILQRDFPHVCCEIVQAPVQSALITVPVSGYYLWLSFAGVLRGNFAPSYKNIIDEMTLVMFAMSTWYYENRILPDAKRFKKFKITDNASSTNQ
jgi:hypothetical protein